MEEVCPALSCPCRLFWSRNDERCIPYHLSVGPASSRMQMVVPHLLQGTSTFRCLPLSSMRTC